MRRDSAAAPLMSIGHGLVVIGEHEQIASVDTEKLCDSFQCPVYPFVESADIDIDKVG